LVTEITPIRIVFFGTPSYAVPTLEALTEDARYRIALVVTQPDRPAGRGREVQASAVKRSAMLLGHSIYQPDSLREESARAVLDAARADVFVVAAYGLIFGRKTLSIPKYGCLNLHASLLPAYRGASPVAAAILAGDRITGVSLMVMETGLDMGPVVDRLPVPISEDDTTASLSERLGAAAARLAVKSIDRYIRGDLVPEPQDPNHATNVRPLVKADGWIDWTQDATSIERRVRAMWPWPRAWTTIDSAPLQIHAATVVVDSVRLAPGEVSLASGEPIVGCARDSLRIDTVQPAGRNAMSGRAWAAGRQARHGLILGRSGAPEMPPPLIEPASSSPPRPQRRGGRR
jgi:methionyl-tRNA formyltransferase